jgi:hypothetical protein
MRTNLCIAEREGVEVQTLFNWYPVASFYGKYKMLSSISQNISWGAIYQLLKQDKHKAP